MTQLSMKEVARLASSAGVTRQMLPTAVAVAMAESRLDPAAVGDTRLVDAKWGPSLGLWQIRSLKAERGTGRTRDADRLTNPEFNARSMFQISTSGTNWAPWSTYTSGAYREHLAAAEKAVNAQLGPDPVPEYLRYTPPAGQRIPRAGGGTGAQTVGFDPPGPDFMYGLGGIGLGLLNGGRDLLNGEADKLRAAVLEGLIWSAALGLGVSLVLIGTWGTVRKAAQEVVG
jgi:hypothetical protein